MSQYGDAAGRRPLGQNAEISDLIQKLVKKNETLARMLPKMGTAADDNKYRQDLARVRNEGKDLCQRILRVMKDVKYDVCCPLPRIRIQLCSFVLPIQTGF